MRILLADGQPKVRFALRVLLEQRPEFEVAAEAADAKDLLECVKVDCPDLILLGWELPGMTDGDLLAALRRLCPNLAVIARVVVPGPITYSQSSAILPTTSAAIAAIAARSPGLLGAFRL